MSNHDKWFSYFLGGSFIVAILMIILYRAIKTTADIFAFMFLSSLIIMFFTTFLLESILLEPVIDRIIGAAEKSRFVYNFIFFSLFVSIVVLIPSTIAQSIKTTSGSNGTNSNICYQVVEKIIDSPKSFYDPKLLTKCQYTKPLTRIISAENKNTKKDIHDLSNVVDDYLGLMSKNLSFVVALFLAIIGGASYLVILGLAIKKGSIVLLALFSSAALKMFADGALPPEKKQ